MLDTISTEVRVATRRLKRSPGFALFAVALLGLGLGATLSAYRAVHEALWQPLPFDNAERIVRLNTVSSDGVTSEALSPALWLAIQDSTAIESAAAVRPADVNVNWDQTFPRRGAGWQVSQEFFDVLELAPTAGRVFAEEDHRSGAAAVALVRASRWERLEGDPKIIRLNGVDHEVLGAFPPTLDLLQPGLEVLTPLRIAPQQLQNRTPYLGLLAKLPPGPLRETELARLGAAYGPSQDPIRIDAESLRTLAVGSARQGSVLLFFAVLLALLVVCFNVGNLLLARSIAGQQNVAIRQVLGARPLRLIREASLESALLIAAAAVLGGGCAAAFDRLAAALRPTTWSSLTTLDRLAIDLPFVLLIGALTVGLVGVVPAIRTVADARARLGTRAVASRTTNRVRASLTAAEMAVTVVLVLAAAVFLQALWRVTSTDPGFDGREAVTAQFSLPFADYPSFNEVRRGFERILEQAASAPQIGAVAALSSVPLAGSTVGANFALDGAERETNARLRIATPGATQVVGLRLVAGRDVSASDGASGTDVVLVNRALLESLGQTNPSEALGQRLLSRNSAFAGPDGEPRRFEIIGVLDNVRSPGLLATTAPELVLPLAQAPAEPFSWTGNSMMLAALPAAGASTELTAQALRRSAAAVDANLPLYDVATLEQRLHATQQQERFAASVTFSLGAITLLLAAAGIYALGAFLFASRRAEVGLRLALGAAPKRLVREFALAGAAPAACGIALGLLVAMIGFWLLRQHLPAGVPMGAITGAVVLLASAALLASWLPARRSLEVDPAEVLRAAD